MGYVLVFMTVPSENEAEKITQILLEKRLIACANILGPVKSKFWWHDKTDNAKECYVIMKSDEKLFRKLSATIAKMHSYEVPEILAVPIVKGWQPYLNWLKISLKPALAES